MREVKYIVVHCTGASPYQSTAVIKDFWKRTKKWKNVGYHKLVSADGSVEELAKPEQITNGVAGHNRYSYHICYKGGQGGKDTRTEAQKEALRKEVEKAKKMFPKAVVLGHRDLSPDLNGDGIIQPNEWTKECPSFDAVKEYKNI
ncbi:N-acetylmuramoyl-L-alanine amidase [Riemerella anatipestifer]|uniref:N-acetylmuramoyl-L-alanine amidase n=1 Tax=Riemerella anatipestifer TaxID=34085 RepID=UPI001AD7617B|nr:N-acetylmuramoyl-L-alanine amidase [Riemerella anatipestifer]MBO4233898.1 N-acetylmuramoyl-L-alanine amidase [Riemerella anatipestifer]